MNTVHVTADQLSEFAFESGKEVTLRPDHAELRLGSRLFVAPLALPVVPEQRKPEAAS